MKQVDIDTITSLLPANFFDMIFNKMLLTLPKNEEWAKIELLYNNVGNHFELNLQYVDPQGLFYPLDDKDYDIAGYLSELKWLMKHEELGSWYSLRVIMSREEEDSFDIHFNYHEEPQWQQVSKDRDGSYPLWLYKAYTSEEVNFSRKNERTPKWLLNIFKQF